jgi:hypothetical protein
MLDVKRLKQQGYEFQASLSYIARACLKKKKLAIRKTNQRHFPLNYISILFFFLKKVY